MGVTRRFWGELLLSGGLAALAVLLERPVLLVGAAGLGGWLLAQQYAFVRSVARVSEDISVTQSPERDRVTAHDEVCVALKAELPYASPVRLEIEAEPPVGVRTHEAELGTTLQTGDRGVATEFEITGPLAGDFRFERPTVIATDRSGRFRATFDADSTPTLTVSPRRPNDIHVGMGGERLAAPYGDYPTNERGVGLELAEIRAYVPGDTLRHVDWNATARFGRPFVREFQAEADRRTALFIDCRASMGIGPSGATKFDYVREIGLGILGNVRNRGSPLDVVAVGDDGMLDRESVSATETKYEAVEHYLRTLGPQAVRRADETKAMTISPSAARRRARCLRSDESQFAATLEPFFANADPYVERIEGEPLYGAARRHLRRLPGTDLSVVLTDDENRGETREVAKIARRNGNHVVVFLTPTVLFEDDGTFNPEGAYDRYASFEQFRQTLSRMDRVSAFEVGPDDQLEALLAEKLTRRARTGD